ncbi:glycosyltransferase family 2 protein [Rhodohalobacter sulfatireducens]|uniref:Glycosyltransferase n=1 Tax=Rhodohalobacter sulfatireducens TaxID=2911366 RepID=A0ABS9KIW9_9BACT|nr:glycosyltransferase family 2 protein [Rhodohalobacter sulfatireducens]MCG2590791.1 glycosyltransferase [Rhodohalobacter sulfatireducens]
MHHSKKKCSITVIITAYNSAKFISRSINSVVNQKDEECKIIVINDASTDNTWEVVKRYGDRVKYIEFEENKGPAVGRSKGLFETETEFVAFLDADDYWKENFARFMKHFLVANEDLVAANCAYSSISYKGNELQQPSLSMEDKEYYKGGNVCNNFYEYWTKYDCIRTGTVLMRTEIAKKTGGLRKDLRLTEDLEFWGYLATFGNWGFMPKHLFVTDQQILTPSERLKKFKRRFSFFKELDIKSWKKRIDPKLQDSQSKKAFNEYLINIYTTIAFAKAYTFSFKDSYQFVSRNRTRINENGWGKALRMGVKAGPLFWPILCMGLRFREIAKSYLFFMLRST